MASLVIAEHDNQSIKGAHAEHRHRRHWLGVRFTCW